MNIRKFNTTQSILCALVAVLLLIGVGRHPYGFYRFVHLVTFISGGYMAWLMFCSTRHFLAVAFGTIAVLFNPLFPIHFIRGTWEKIDLACAAVFVIGFLISGSSRNSAPSIHK